MKFTLVVLGWLLTLNVMAAPSSANNDAKQLWQLIDYIAVDYGGAVANGEVISEGEYGEMLEFSETAAQQAQALLASSAKDSLIHTTSKLRAAVLGKAESAEVAQLANLANDLIITAYPFPMTPESAPDLKRGAVLYAQQCASCHGDSGGGDGALAAHLDPPPIAFTDATRAQMRSVMALYQVTTQGVEGTSMTSFAALDESDRWALAFFVGTLSYDVAAQKTGEQLWLEDRSLHNYFPDLAAVTTLTEAKASELMPAATARATMAYLRSHPEAVNTGKPSGLNLARLRIRESLSAFESDDRAAATKLALSAYLDGFEPIEPSVQARNKSLLMAVENSMLQYRADLKNGTQADAQATAGKLYQLFDQVEIELGQASNDPTATFMGALLILLREGLEAILIVIGIIAFLKKAQQPKALRRVHAGWICALIAGALTWVISTYVIAISGTSREVTEGLGSILAAVVLLSVGLWMHGKSSADRWQVYLNEKLSAAMSSRSVWALFALSFIAVYREVFETILFYSALSADGNGSALLGGFLTASGLLVIIAAFLLRTSARMPIGKFFSYTSIFVALLAVILTGKGVIGLQEAGWVSVSPVAAPRIDILGILPTAETISAQIIVLIIVVLGYGFNYLRARK